MKFVTVESGRHQTFGKGSPLMAVLAEAASAVYVDQGVAAMICPVLGDSTLTTDGYDCDLNRGDIGATDSLFNATCEVSPRGLCVMLVGGVQAWRRVTSVRGNSVGLVPAIYRKNLLAKELVCVAQRAASGPQTHVHNELGMLLARLHKEFDPFVARCPGSRFSTKFAVFTRLQRARHYIETHAASAIDVGKLALIANYSSTHFITTFRHVFAETPFALLKKHRLGAATRLLADQRIAIGEVATAAGYPSRHSLFEAVRRQFGFSPSAFRTLAAQEVSAP